MFKMIFECKGVMSIFCNMKKQITIPQEFNFVVDKRIPPPTTVLDLFDKLSICLESHHEKPPLPRLTTPNPFHLHTDYAHLFLCILIIFMDINHVFLYSCFILCTSS